MSTRPVFLLVCLAVLSAADAEEIHNGQIAELLTKGEDERGVWQAGLESRLRDVKTGKITTARKQVIQSREHYMAMIARVKAMRGSFLPSLSLEVGSIGCLRKARHYNVLFEVDRTVYLKVFQVIGPRDVLLEWPTASRATLILIWLRGSNTSRLADGQRLTIEKPVHVTGTKQYDTATGSTKTVMVIEPWPVSEARLEEVARSIGLIEDPAKARDKSQQAEQDKWRTWTAGEHTTTARFAGMIGQTVRLKKKDGKTVSIPLSRLSEADRKWITDRK